MTCLRKRNSLFKSAVHFGSLFKTKFHHLNQNSPIIFLMGHHLPSEKFKKWKAFSCYPFNVVFHIITICQLLVLFHFCSGRGKASKHMSLCSEFQKEASQFEKMIKTVPPGESTWSEWISHNLECVPTNGTQARASMSNSWRHSKARLGLRRNQTLKTTVL